MHFLTFFSAILASAVLVTSEPSAQFNSVEIALDGDTSSPVILDDGNLAGNFPSPPSGNSIPGAAEGQSPATDREGAPAPRPEPGAPQQTSPQEVNPNARQQIPPQELNPDTQQQQAPPPGFSPHERLQQGLPSDRSPYGRQQDGTPSNGQLPEGSTSPPPGYRGDQHCRQWGGCPFECHTDCVCWEWCKNAKCNLAVSGEAVLTSAQISCDPSAGEKFIGKVCRVYCANWCEDIKNQIVQVLPSDREQRAFLSMPLECDKNSYNCPADPNPSGIDCLKPTNPLDPGLGGSGGSSGGYGNQQQPNFGSPPSSNYKELDKTNAPDITDFSLDDDDSWLE